MTPYFYVIVRRDLPPVQIAVQAAHAAREAGRAFQDSDETTCLVMLTVDNEEELQQAAARIGDRGIDHKLFYEPDFGPMGHSALATRVVTSKAERRLFSKYPKLEMSHVSAGVTVQ